jgi:UDP-glucose 4-epimerase
MDKHIQKKYVVTGGAGFIGSHLVDSILEDGHQVIVIDNLSNGNRDNFKQHNENKNFLFLEKDITADIEDDEIFGADAVFHLAGIGDVIPSIADPMLYMKNNFHGSLNVFQTAMKYAIPRIVYAASSSCYGTAEVPTDETAPIKCLHPYAVSKYLAEQMLFQLGDIYRLKVSSVCIFNAYGRRFKTTGAYGSVIGVFLKQKLENYPLTIAGDGNQTRDFVHVKDVARAFRDVNEKGKPGNRYNVGFGVGITINSLAKTIGGEVQSISDRGGEARHTLANISKIENEVGWYPRIAFEDGCLDMLANISDWDTAPFWTTEKINEAVSNWNNYFEADSHGN